MVQVDVFWAYSIGAGFAVAAAHELRWTAESRAGSSAGPLSSGRHLATVVLYCGTLLAPSGIWLLWDFPEWETMQVGGPSMPAWLVACFAATIVAQGAAGFLVAQALIVRGQTRWAALQAVAGYYVMFLVLVHGWDGTGYRRVLSTDKADYLAWEERSLSAHVGHWATSQVALTLAATGIVMIPAMLALLYRSYRDGLRHIPGGRPGIPALLTVVFGSILLTLGAAVATSLLIRAFTALTGSVPAGWALAGAAMTPPLWLLIIRRGALTTRIIDRLALPPERPA